MSARQNVHQAGVLSQLISGHSMNLREGATRFYGIFFFNQLLTLSGREIIKLAAYMTYFQNESIYIHKARLLSDACIVNNYR